jgi:hypothetical protein
MNSPPATTKPSDPYAKLAAEESGGAILKFSKGDWLTSDEDSHNDEIMTADMVNLMKGSRKWKDNKIVDTDIGYVAESFAPKERNDLGDLDEADWPKNKQGEPVDPWEYGYFIRLADESGRVYAWSAISAGAKRAIGDLSRQFSRKRRNPLVKLTGDSYRHPTYGKVIVPVLEVVGWTDDVAPTAATLPPPGANIAAFPDRARGSATITSGRNAVIDDDIPFMWEGR